MNVSFPLPEGYFPPLEYTPKDEAKWKRSVVELVQLGLREERRYATSLYVKADETQWKLLREKDRLRVYRRRSSATLAGSSAHSVLAIGTIKGTLEEVIQGSHHVTTQDMRTTTSFLRSDILDAAVLHVFENGTDDDPFRSFAVKWRMVESSIAKKRDLLGLEYMGIDVDARGERFAFHVFEDFEHKVCPPFHPHCAIRAKSHTRMIYRQISQGHVGVYLLGDYTLSGSLPSMLVRLSTAEIAFAVGKSVDCTEAKKLTSLALSSSAVPHTIHPGKTLSCTICYQSPGMLTTRTIALCHLCGTTVCSKCRSRKHLLSDEEKIPVTCCNKCLVAAKSLALDPRVPLQLVSAARWRSQHAIEGDDQEWERKCRAVEQQSLSSRLRRNGSDGALPVKVASRAGTERSRSIGTRSTPDADSNPLSNRSNTSSIDLSYLDSVGVDLTKPNAKRLAASPVVDKGALVARQPSSSPTPTLTPMSERERLWRQMNALRATAEQTYRLTKHTNQLYVDRSNSNLLPVN